MDGDDPWAPTRYRFISPGRGPEEWGRVLYEEPWDAKKLMEAFQFLFIWAFVLFVVPWLGYAILDTLREEGLGFSGLPFGVFMLGLMALVVFFALFATKGSLTTSEFRVYEGGPTKVKVPLSKGLLRREVLIEKERIRHVRLRSSKQGGSRGDVLVIEHTDARGREGTTTVKMHKVPDPQRAFRALDEILPGRLSDEMRRVIDPDREVMEQKEPEGFQQRGDRWMDTVISALILFMAAFPIGMIIPMLPRIVSYPTLYLDIIFIFIGMSVLFLHMALMTTVRMYVRQWFNIGSGVTEVPGGFSVPTTLMSRMILRTKAMVPYVDIRHARRYMDSDMDMEMYEVLTTGDRRFVVKQSVFRALQRRPEFQETGFELVNTLPVPRGHPPMLSVHYFKLTALLLAMAFAVALASPTLLALSEEEVSQSSEGPVEPGPLDYIVLNLTLALVVFVCFKFIQVRRISAIRRLSEDFNVDRSSMSIPMAEEPFRTVRRVDVEHIEARRFSRLAKAPVLWVETSEGTFHLPVDLAGELRENGYVVEDPNGLL